MDRSALFKKLKLDRVAGAFASLAAWKHFRVVSTVLTAAGIAGASAGGTYLALRSALHGGAGHATAPGAAEHGGKHADAHGHGGAGKHGAGPADPHGKKAHGGEEAGKTAKSAHEGGASDPEHGDKHAEAHESAERAPAIDGPGIVDAKVEHAEVEKPKGLIGKVAKAVGDIQDKVDRIHEAETENERLRLENAHLRLRAESLQFDCRAKDAAALTRELGARLGKSTGLRSGRTLASIAYRPPVHLMPAQLHTLGVSYFKGREDEKAAVILTLLTDQEESDAFKTPRNYLMAGVSWYRLDNLELADKYFSKILDGPEDATTYRAQARLWKALVSERLNRHGKAQYWLRELIDKHPHATESAWINEANRAPAVRH